MQRREFIQRALGGAVAVFARLYVPVVGSMVGQNPLSAWANLQQNPLTRQFCEFPLPPIKTFLRGGTYFIGDVTMKKPLLEPGRAVGSLSAP